MDNQYFSMIFLINYHFHNIIFLIKNLNNIFHQIKNLLLLVHIQKNNINKIIIQIYTFFWRFYDLGEKAQHHCQSFLISYQAFRVILPHLYLDSDLLIDQILVIALNNNLINVHSAKLENGKINYKISSAEMLDSFIIHLYFFIKFIKNSVIRLYHNFTNSISNTIDTMNPYSKSGKIE